MTREQLLRYAQKTGGMFGRQLTIAHDGDHYTLDQVYWAGNTYVFIYNVTASTFSYKVVYKLPAIKSLCDSAMSLAKETDPGVQTPASFNMIYKLHQLTQKD